MENLVLIALLDMKESLRARWFLVYSLVFGGLIALFFVAGVTESQVMGFSGLSRLLLMYIQITIVILPIFILVTTVRSISGDRDNHILEYMLSFPLSLSHYYWGKILGRFATVFLPVFFAMVLALLIGVLKGASIPWSLFLFYTGLLFALSSAFLGIAFLISSSVKSSEVALGLSFFVWIFLLAFIDIILISLMMQNRFSEELIIAIALVNPMEVFRVAAISLFDPELTVMGPVAFYILDNVKLVYFLLFSIAYPVCLGLLFAFLGFKIFTKNDLI
ncbi:MAG: ABC transporter permease [Epsilonproteobacteria bacterium]|jgi:ABC-2 type transport system permease protein|uniref:ABC transporter permease n=1 Tax=Sulfurospirillum cavolei TaxID=366522 RepID=A0A2D3WCZ9_9BACT|nr:MULTISPECIES: ABC transporter permease subunit [Sulfurospirillum]NCB55129.1 ABC transporter permease [Campylobacterota bacterium]KHG33373.1 MAG: ABC transporter permease [Sulfurospirillum sp. MES]MCD8543675.1 ABC transporter permease [Sulfurospirillum cavolei]MCP3651646.1 ABC transporter permease [Sulfurospirillum sp. DNRA8]MCR1810493.1 ABC transporter permease [Sulfurospirillum sp. DNRA8]